MTTLFITGPRFCPSINSRPVPDGLSLLAWYHVMQPAMVTTSVKSRSCAAVVGSVATIIFLALITPNVVSICFPMIL